MNLQAAASSSVEEEGVSPVALSHRFQAALHSMAPPPHNGNSPLEPREAARFLLAGHHPRTTVARSRSSSVWYAASRESCKLALAWCGSPILSRDGQSDVRAISKPVQMCDGR